jgi:hypothetical protein
MAAAFVLLFQNERAIHRERIFRDRFYLAFQSFNFERT